MMSLLSVFLSQTNNAFEMVYNFSSTKLILKLLQRLVINSNK